MGVDHVFAGVPVADLQTAWRWYEELAGRAPDLIPNDREAAWRFTDTGWLYIVADPERAGRALVTLLVDDLDAWVERLGISTEEIEEIPGAVRRTTLVDPDGNRVQLGQPLR